MTRRLRRFQERYESLIARVLLLGIFATGLLAQFVKPVGDALESKAFLGGGLLSLVGYVLSDRRSARVPTRATEGSRHVSALPPAARRAVALLRELGAVDIVHPGGTLLVHLQRVREQLAAWGARPALQLAGLCHASYGTDGFPAALLSLDRRTELAAVIGAEAEAIVYLYASCDRKATYPKLTEADGAFRDRFTGCESVPEPQLRRDFAELTAANELDLARIDASFRERWRAELLALFTRFRPLLSQPAWSACRAVLASEAHIDRL